MNCWTVFLSAFVILTITLISCKSSTSEISESYDNTVIVDLGEGVTSEKLESAFRKYDLQEKKKLSRPLNIVLFTFNQDKIEVEKLVIELRESSLVDNAQTNKEINTRN
jgi:hypothetical protein